MFGEKNCRGMIEVFKTDVIDRDQAKVLIDRIHETFHYCEANFDLQDCDKILRVKGISSERETFTIISLVKTLGYDAQVLPDDYPFFDNLVSSSNKDGETVK
jgi:hypothetical protein